MTPFADWERFAAHWVATPRHADAYARLRRTDGDAILVVTRPDVPGIARLTAVLRAALLRAPVPFTVVHLDLPPGDPIPVPQVQLFVHGQRKATLSPAGIDGWVRHGAPAVQATLADLRRAA